MNCDQRRIASLMSGMAVMEGDEVCNIYLLIKTIGTLIVTALKPLYYLKMQSIVGTSLSKNRQTQDTVICHHGEHARIHKFNT